MGTFIIIAIIIYVLIWAWCIYEIKNAQEVDPNDETFLS